MPEAFDSLLCFLCQKHRDASECDVFDSTGHVVCSYCMAAWMAAIEGDEPDPLPFEHGYEPEPEIDVLYAANDNADQSDEVA